MTTLPQYNQVELTEQEAQKALHDARVAKFWKMEDERKQAEKNKKYNDAISPWTYQQQYDAARVYATNLAGISGRTEYVFDQHIKPLFHLLTQYFTNDKKFEEDGRLLSKGIMLIGNVGVGKTDLLKSFMYNKRMCFLPVTSNEIEYKIREKGLEYWQIFAGYVPGHGSTPDYFYQPNIGWMIDDMGTEEVIKDYGNPLDSLERIIHQRYILKEKITFCSLHITTNLNADMIEKRYGTRMRSRLREMFNVIELKGSDRRV